MAGGHQHDHGRPRAADLQTESAGTRRRWGLAMLVAGALLLSGGTYLLLRPRPRESTRPSQPTVEGTALARALELRAAGRLDECVAVLEQAVAEHPDDVPLAAELGWVRLMRGDAQGAIGVLEQAAAADPSGWSIQLDLAAAYLALERGQDALQSARRAREAALQDAQRAREASPPQVAAAWLYEGRALFMLGRVEEGLPAVRSAAELAAGDPGIASELAQALLVAGRPGEACVQFERLCVLLPDRWEPRLDLARLRLDLGDREGALRALEEARALAPEEPSLLSLEAELGAGR